MDVDVNMRKRKIFNSYQDLIYFINNNNLINKYKNVKMVLSTIKWYNTKIINEKPIIFFEYDDKNIRVALFTCRLTPIKKMVLDTNGNRILKESDLDWPDYKRAQMIFIFNTSFNFWNYVIQNLIKINDFINISVSYNEFVILQKVLASDKFDVLEYWTAYNNDYFKYSFGRIAFISYIKKCIETGVKSIDCCGTIHKYKLDLVNDIKKMYEINIFTKSQIGRRLKHVKCLYPQSML